MKFFAVLFVVVQAVLMQGAYSQVIRTATVTAPVIAQPSVANTLADTLSLLTVSSLLAETLPLNPNVIATVPVPMAAPCAPACATAYAPAMTYGNYGYGCGCGCNRYYDYIY